LVSYDNQKYSRDTFRNITHLIVNILLTFITGLQDKTNYAIYV